MYSPYPEYLDIDFPKTYRDYLLDELKYLQRNVPTDARELNAWLWTCADCLVHIALGPKNNEQVAYCVGVLAAALADKTGRAAYDCTSLITHRTLLAINKLAAERRAA